MMLWPAFVLGVTGSLHCIGMCGPLALALPVPGKGRVGMVLGRLAYSGGRMTTYAGLGAAIGLVGQGLAIAGFQQTLSVAAGVGMILWLIMTRTALATTSSGRLLARAMVPLKAALGRRLMNGSLGSLFTVGLLNGFLPCGLVYLALTTAIASGSAAGGALSMLVFGLGTVPAMLAVSLLGAKAQWSLRRNVLRAVPVLVLVLAVLFVLRGLSLGIPYISPVLNSGSAPSGTACGCH